MRKIILAVNIMCALLCLSACRHVVNEDAVMEPEPGMDPAVRQLMMQGESEYPQQEEGWIPAPSDLLRIY